MDKRIHSVTNNMYQNIPVDTQNRQSRLLDRPLAIANIPMQLTIVKVYSPVDALRRGTLFPELDKPFNGIRGAY